MSIIRISTLAASVLTGLALVAAPAHAIDFRSMIGIGVGTMQRLNGMARRAEVAKERRRVRYRAQMRRYHLSRTKAGRRQLIREDRAARARAREERKMRRIRGVIAGASERRHE